MTCGDVLRHLTPVRKKKKGCRFGWSPFAKVCLSADGGFAVSQLPLFAFKKLQGSISFRKPLFIWPSLSQADLVNEGNEGLTDLERPLEVSRRTFQVRQREA